MSTIEGHGGDLALAVLREHGVDTLFTLSGGHLFSIYDGCRAEGIRLIDTTDKTRPVETSFYLPNANKNLACNQNCSFQGRETWGAYFGSDGYIYASDFWLGFFIVNPG